MSRNEYDYDLLVIGGGSGGVSGARRSAEYGARVALCEADRVGGTCVLRGCVPKKLLVYASSYAADFIDAGGYGWTVEGPRLNWPALIERKDRELERLEAIYLRMLRDAGVDLLRGRARFRDAHTVEVDGKAHTAAHVLVATGSRPLRPEIPGAELGMISDDALDLPELPPSMVIVGGGYIGCEFASIFAACGVRVELIVRADSVLRGFDQDLRQCLAGEMRQRGIELRVETTVRSIERQDGRYSLRLAHGELVDTDQVLLATGRIPNTEDLGLEQAGVEVGERGCIVVDRWSRSSVESVYAVGDVTDRLPLTPVAIAESRAVARTLFRNQATAMDHTNIARAVFSQPPVAAVGLTEEEARAADVVVDVYRARFRPLKHTLSGREEKALMKLVVDRQTDRVLGCHMVGADAPEIIQGLAVAVQCGATKAQFDATVGIHPTAAEEFVTMRDPLPDPQPGGS